MRKYKAFYKGKVTEVEANTPYEAQKKAALLFKIRRAYYEVSVMLMVRYRDE